MWYKNALSLKFYDDQDVMVEINYKCHDPYSETQRVEYLGIIITAWHPSNSLVSESVSMDAPFAMAAAVEAAKKLCTSVRTKCCHPKPIHVANVGNCLNRYRCPDCGAVYEVDSSG